MKGALAIFLFIYIVTIYAKTIDPKAPWECPKNEVYYKCSLEVCETDCKDLKEAKACAILSPDCFVPGCVCVEGMLRNKAGVCVPTAKCD